MQLPVAPLIVIIRVKPVSGPQNGDNQKKGKQQFSHVLLTGFYSCELGGNELVHIKKYYYGLSNIFLRDDLKNPGYKPADV